MRGGAEGLAERLRATLQRVREPAVLPEPSEPLDTLESFLAKKRRVRDNVRSPPAAAAAAAALPGSAEAPIVLDDDD